MEKEKLLYIETFGCQMNMNDSEKIISMLKEVGYKPTDDAFGADLIIFNTCTVRAKAEQKMYSSLGRFRELKKENKKAIIGVGGCIAQQEGERLLKKAPFVNLVFGTHNLHLVPDMVTAAEQGRRLAHVDFLDSETRRELFPENHDGDGVTKFVTIMQGCDNFCSYCIVPYVRGKEISRRSGEIIDEIEKLADRGVKEITLLGQNVNSYGLKEREECDFPQLLRKISQVQGIDRIRFTTSHPKDLSPALVACFAELPKLCNHIHLPAQSGSDAILTRMERGYTRQEYLDKIDLLKLARPDIQITGDLIVGFPGETEDDFQLTLSLMEEVQYSDQFSFIFSARPETKAAGFLDNVSYQEKQQRLARLQDLQKRLTRQRNKTFVGSVQEILVEGASKQADQLFGRTSGNRIVNFIGAPGYIGHFISVRITRAFQNSLLGELV